jgi:hypothetical protein
MSILNLIEALGKKEQAITDQVIVSPVFNNTQIVTKIAGIAYALNIPKLAPAWYNFRPVNLKRANSLGFADLGDVSLYLDKLPKIRVIMVYKKDLVYYGVPLKNNSLGFQPTELIPVFLPGGLITDFSTCICRYDGANIWYQGTDIWNDIARVDYLQQSLEKLTLPESIQFLGMTFEEKIAYSIRFKMDATIRESLKEKGIQHDVEFAGGKFIKSIEKDDHFSVTYEVDGEKYTSIVSKGSVRQVLSAGICLSGTDTEYDLKTLVSVIREGQNRELIHRTSHDF